MTAPTCSPDVTAQTTRAPFVTRIPMYTIFQADGPKAIMLTDRETGRPVVPLFMDEPATIRYLGGADGAPCIGVMLPNRASADNFLLKAIEKMPPDTLVCIDPADASCDGTALFEIKQILGILRDANWQIHSTIRVARVPSE